MEYLIANKELSELIDKQYLGVFYDSEVLPLPLPITIGTYTLTRLLGRGADGIVYYGMCNGKPYAIKQTLGSIGANHEIKMLDAITTKNIKGVVRLHDFLRVKSALEGHVSTFIVMDICEPCITLREVSHSLSKEQKANIISQVNRTLQLLHNVGICHNDITFNNILFNTRTNEPLLIDFSKARFTKDCNDTNQLVNVMDDNCLY